VPQWLLKGVGLDVALGLLAGIALVAWVKPGPEGSALAIVICVLVATVIGHLVRLAARKRGGG
jgi:hypothetical protein